MNPAIHIRGPYGLRYIKHHKDNFSFLGTENILVHNSSNENSARIQDATLFNQNVEN